MLFAVSFNTPSMSHGVTSGAKGNEVSLIVIT